ncbi:Uncharacterised protein [Vibrio cholerae]|nr:Uncharacterised protein [Vibrio cholerae]
MICAASAKSRTLLRLSVSDNSGVNKFAPRDTAS